MTIEINLLPWREEARARRSRRFTLGLVLMALIGFGAGYGITGYYEQRLSAQEERNRFVEARSRQLEAAVQEVSDLEEVRQDMEAQVRVFAELQAGRAQTVYVLNDLVTSLVDGVHYTRLERQGDSLQIAGVAENNRQVSDQLRALDNVASLAEPVLSEVEAEPGRRRRHFSLSLGQRMPTAPEGGPGGQP